MLRLGLACQILLQDKLSDAVVVVVWLCLTGLRASHIACCTLVGTVTMHIVMLNLVVASHSLVR